MHTILALLLAFCLSINPGESWECSPHPSYGYACYAESMGDSYYIARVDRKARAITVYQTDGDSYADYVTTIEIK